MQGRRTVSIPGGGGLRLQLNLNVEKHIFSKKAPPPCSYACHTPLLCSHIQDANYVREKNQYE